LFSDQFRRGESEESKLSGVKGSKLISNLSNVAWKAFQSVNTLLPEGESVRPKWAPGPLLKSYERTSPPLGFPRETDSLCPRCVKEVREAVISGETTLESLMNEHPGEIKAQIVEENGQVVMRKTCPKHGEFVDVMATDPAFLERIESLFFGRDFKAADDSHDNNDKLDLDQVNQVLILDVNGLLGMTEGDNTLWIGNLKAVAK